MESFEDNYNQLSFQYMESPCSILLYALSGEKIISAGQFDVIGCFVLAERKCWIDLVLSQT